MQSHVLLEALKAEVPPPGEWDQPPRLYVVYTDTVMALNIPADVWDAVPAPLALSSLAQAVHEPQGQDVLKPHSSEDPWGFAFRCVRTPGDVGVTTCTVYGALMDGTLCLVSMRRDRYPRFDFCGELPLSEATASPIHRDIFLPLADMALALRTARLDEPEAGGRV